MGDEERSNSQMPGATPSVRPRVLIVDDNPGDRDLVMDLLGSGYEFVQANTAAGGRTMLDSSPPVHCVLLDYRLPDFHGDELLPAALERSLGAVMLTGMGDERIAAACLHAGAHEYLCKDDISAEALERAIRSAIEKATLMRELSLYKEVVEKLPIGVTVACWEDRADVGSFRYLLTNAASEEATGVARERLVDSTLGEQASVLGHDGVPSAYAQACLGGEQRPLPGLQSGSPPRHWERVVAPLTGDKVVILTEDVTEREATRRERERLEQQVVEVQRIETVGRLAAGVAHDFNNLLTVILSYGAFVHARLRPGDPSLRDIERVQEAAARAAELTAKLLAFSRKQVLRLEVVDLNHTVVQVDGMLRGVLGEAVRVVTSLEPRPWLVDVDVGQMEQVIMNLCVNARDAMPCGGTLRIETSNHRRGSADATATVPAGDYVRLSVVDDGCGMDAETLQRIFEPFFTTKGMHGTGLGLSTVYGIVKQSGGHIEADSTPGVGTRFDIYLQRAASGRTRTERPVPVRLTARPKAAGTILLVEDNAGVRDATRRILRREGYEVLVADGAAEAVSLSDTHDKAIHLLLTDVIMPGMNGSELARQLQAARPAMRVVFMSGYTAEAIGRRGILEPGVLFLPKPFDGKQLVEMVGRAMEEAGDSDASPPPLP